MKLTKESLKKIIQEELETMMNEKPRSGIDTGDQQYQQMVSGFYNAMYKALVNYGKMASKGQTPETQEAIKRMVDFMNEALQDGMFKFSEYERKAGRADPEISLPDKSPNFEE